MTHTASPDRYDSMPYRRCGRSGLLLPAITLGLWQNFGDDRDHDEVAAIVTRAFDRGVTHFDLANNYGPPPGHAESAFGRVIKKELAGHRDELVISTKAGYRMWDGPYGEWGSRKYLLSSLDQSLRRTDLDYVDIFYSHRFDPDTPLEETMDALASAVHSGKALYAGLSSYSPAATRRAAALLDEMGIKLLIHQPSYSMLNRWIEDGLLATLDGLGVGCIPFSVLAQGMLTDKYVSGIPAGSRRTAEGGTLDPAWVDGDIRARISALAGIAAERGQSLGQMAIAWSLRDPRVTTALLGASSVAQLDENLDALDSTDFSDDELAAIDLHAVDSGIDLWKASRTAG